MTTIPRAPFYVPRVGDDPIWIGAPMSSGAIIATNTQQKVFGQHGQVPTHNFASNYTFDDPAVWSGSPLSADMVFQLSHQYIYSQGGQVSTRNFAPLYTYDDPSVWWFYGEPDGSYIITALSAQHIHGAGGQVQAYNFAPTYTYDDAATWNWSSRSSQTIHPLLTAAGKPKTPSYNSLYAVDDPAVWSGQPVAYPLTDQVKQQAPFKQGFASLLTYDDPASWSGQPVGYPLLYQTGKMPVAPFYTHKYDDATHWNWLPLRSQLIHPLLTAAGQVLARNFSPLYTQDDAAPWSGSPVGVDRALFNLLGTPFVLRTWMFGWDDASIWSGNPISSGSVTLTRTQQIVFGQHGQVPTRNFVSVYTWDDASPWSGSPIISPRSMLNTLQFFIPAANAKAWPFIGFDDYSIWTPQPYNSKLLPQPTSLTGSAIGRWTFNAYYDEIVWPSGPRPVSSLLTAVPFFARRWRETFDDPPAWQGNANPVPMTLQGKSPFLPFKFNFDLPDFPPWSMTMLLSLSIRVTPPPTHFKNFFTFGGLYNFNIPSDDPELLPPRPSRLLYIPLLLFKRIANAIFQTRNGLASKDPASLAPYEARTAFATNEDRTSNVDGENRTGNAPGGDV